MKSHRPFIKPPVWVWWGNGWAVQFWPSGYVSLGFHLDVRRPVLDLHVGWFIVSIGNKAHITVPRDRHRQSCRGFIQADDPIL